MNDSDTDPLGKKLPLALRPPFVFLIAILLGIALNLAWPLPFAPGIFRRLGAVLCLCAILVFTLCVREFRRAGTDVRRTGQVTAIVQTGPYRFSRNPIYLSFILFVIGLSLWLNGLWLLVTLVPPVLFIATIVIPGEERFLEREFPEHYSRYKSSVRRWL